VVRVLKNAGGLSSGRPSTSKLRAHRKGADELADAWGVTLRDEELAMLAKGAMTSQLVAFVPDAAPPFVDRGTRAVLAISGRALYISKLADPQPADNDRGNGPTVQTSVMRLIPGERTATMSTCVALKSADPVRRISEWRFSLAIDWTLEIETGKPAGELFARSLARAVGWDDLDLALT
jgi:hypothetical protein